MSSPNRRRFKLAELRQKESERTGDAFEIETDSGETFEIAAPGFWPDAVKEHIAAGNDVKAAQVLLGQQRYLQFREAGGRASDVLLALRAFADDQGVELGESSASSSS